MILPEIYLQLVKKPSLKLKLFLTKKIDAETFRNYKIITIHGIPQWF